MVLTDFLLPNLEQIGKRNFQVVTWAESPSCLSIGTCSVCLSSLSSQSKPVLSPTDGFFPNAFLCKGKHIKVSPPSFLSIFVI